MQDDRAYAVEWESRKYQVEVELLENTEKHIHVAVSVDDGTLPASIRPLFTSFIRNKAGSDEDSRQDPLPRDENRLR